MSYQDLPGTLARINAAIASAADDERRQRLAQLLGEARQARGLSLRGAYLDEVPHLPWADEPQPLVDTEHTIDIIDELYDTASAALEQRTAALGERAHAERRARDRNRLATAIRRWCGRG